MSASGKTVVLGVSGGIAAYKAAEIVSRLVKAGVEVNVIMTRSACEFITPLTLQTLSQNPVAVDTFEAPQAWEVEHIALAKKADLFLVAPATANIIAKMALGIADDMLSTTALAMRAPLLVAPAMNTVMWQHPATRKNLETLISRGASTIGPDGGQLACGDVGAGRMSEPVEIVDKCLEMFNIKQDLLGRKVLVTAGPTREMIDPVRYISNRSSGKMGYAVAQAARARGASVTLVSGPVSLTPAAGIEIVNVLSTQDLFEVMTRLAPWHDVIIQAAAPADFTPVSSSGQKLKKQGNRGLTLELAQTQDVAKAIGIWKKPGQVFVGFAAETEDFRKNAARKLKSKNLDLIALNDVTQSGAGFDVDTNALTLITAESSVSLPMMSKQEAAHRLLDAILKLKPGEGNA